MTHLIPPTYFNPNLKLILIPLLLALGVTICILLSVKQRPQDPVRTTGVELRHRHHHHHHQQQQQHEHGPRSNHEDEVILLANASRSLIAMEIRARRLEDNMRRVRERTRTLLWKNKDRALWKILFKNLTRNTTIRHEFHPRRIVVDADERLRDYEYKSRANDDFPPTDDYDARDA